MRHSKKKKHGPHSLGEDITASVPSPVDHEEPGALMTRKKKKKRKHAATDVDETAIAAMVPVSSIKVSKRKKRKSKESTVVMEAAVSVGSPKKKRRKQEKLGTGKAAAVPATSTATPEVAIPPGASAEIASLLREFSDPKVKGTLSDRLNETHPCYDAEFKKRWKLFTKKERLLIVDCDRNKIAKMTEKTSSIKHPFQVDEADHCESAIEAFRDIQPILSLLARTLWKKDRELKIYDPFYCAGAIVDHLGELGFKDVYNKCEDFYAAVREGRVPEHDVVVTNPPYSGDHVERLLKWARSNGKPFLLLMPNYFISKPYYEEALGGKEAAQSMLYLFPWKRYMYWTPKGLRAKDKVQGHVGAGGNRTSPFVSFWYLDLAPVVTPRNALKWWMSGAGGSPAAWVAKLSKINNLPEQAWEGI